MNNEPLLRVKCFLLDMDGTFNLGEGLIEGSLDFIDTLGDLAAAHGATLAQVALAWLISLPGVVAIPGARTLAGGERGRRRPRP